MDSIIIGSTRASSGKTSIIAGMLLAYKDKKIGYLKPFGDRLIYKRKRNWDYDSNFIIEYFDLNEEPESLTLGFDHSKLRYMYDEGNIEKTIQAMADNVSKDKDMLIIESGKNITYGASLNLDAISISKYLNATLVIVASGDNDIVVDDLKFISQYVNTNHIKFGGVIINKITDMDEFEDIYLREIHKMGIKVVGLIPFKEHLSHFTVGYLADKLYAKIISGDRGLNNTVKNIFVGAQSTDESVRNPLFNKEKKLVITSGDREDTILAALEMDTSAIVLSNNIMPKPNILRKSDEKNIPILLVTMDTYQVSTQVHRIEALITNDREKLASLADMVKTNININEILAVK